MECSPGDRAEPWGPGRSSTGGRSRGLCHRAGGHRAAGRWRMPLPGQWVPLGCRGTDGGAPRPLSLRPLRKIPQTAAEGLPSPLPWGSCSRCSCCSSTPAPAGTHCPRPPAFSPLAAPASSFLSTSISMPLPGPVERERRPLRRLGDPHGAAPLSPPAAAKEEPGCGQGLPGRAGTGTVPRGRALPAARTWKSGVGVLRPRSPPSTSPIFLA